MSDGVHEPDWKLFRKLREVALDRYYRRILAEVEDLTRDESRTHRQRYRALFDLLRDRDSELARAFDDPRRSRMISQLAAIHGLGLLEPEEVARFSPETRGSMEIIRSLSQ